MKGKRSYFSGIASDALDRLVHGTHADPHSILGAHPARIDGKDGVVVRSFHPDAKGCALFLEDGSGVEMLERQDGLFAGFVAGRAAPLRYWLRFTFADGSTWDRDDPYRFPPTLGDVDLHLFNKGDHRRLWEVLGAHPMNVGGIDGTRFSVWAPNALRVSVVGDFCRWDGRLLPMRTLGASGIYELFVPNVGVGEFYKYEIKARDGTLRLKTDPFAQMMEKPPLTASCVTASHHHWCDDEWMRNRTQRDWAREPMSIYEVHIGSWARVPEEADRWLTYREIAPRLVDHCRFYEFTHVELMPVAEHAFYGSWGYQVTGYYAPTSRYGSADDLRYLVDHLHQAGIGVLMDWVPAHFPRDDFSLRRFDGTALYEHEDPRLGEHPDWGTLIFNFGRNEVRNFLIANALYWLKEFHVDALRVDAVASMLYLDYSRKEGEWVPNIHGGRENIEAIEFLRACNSIIGQECPGAFAIAEESTAWGGVSKPVHEGGLGFAFKWNMGWMHDTLLYFSKEPVHRKYHHDTLTFAMIYEYTERFINPLSHDEVVHGKGSLLSKMPGDPWQKFANLRVLLTYMYTRPGKQLLFMGTELAPDREWHHDTSLDWHLHEDPMRKKFSTFLATLGHVYRENPCFWRCDPDSDGFAWIDGGDAEQSVFSYRRRAEGRETVVVLNLTPVPREGYRVGVPSAGRWIERFSSDDPRFGGSSYETLPAVNTEPVPMHGLPQSLRLRLPPLGALILVPA